MLKIFYFFALVHMLNTFTIKTGKKILLQKKVLFCFFLHRCSSLIGRLCFGKPEACVFTFSLCLSAAFLQKASPTRWHTCKMFEILCCFWSPGGLGIVTNSQLTLAVSAFWLWSNLAAESIDSILVTLDVLEWSGEDCSGLLFLTDARCTIHQFSTEEVAWVWKLGAETK